MNGLKLLLLVVAIVLVCSALITFFPGDDRLMPGGAIRIPVNTVDSDTGESVTGDLITTEEKVTPSEPESYEITYTLSHVTGSADNPTICYTKTHPGATLSFVADSGYVLPENVTVIGTTYIWNRITGVLSLSSTNEPVHVSIEAVKTTNVTIEGDWGDNRTANYEIKNGGVLIWSGCSLDCFTLENIYIDHTKDTKITTDNTGIDRGFIVYNGTTVVAQSNNNNDVYTATIPAGTEFNRIVFYDHN